MVNPLESSSTYTVDPRLSPEDNLAVFHTETALGNVGLNADARSVQLLYLKTLGDLGLHPSRGDCEFIGLDPNLFAAE